jgi:hypothetical protein
MHTNKMEVDAAEVSKNACSCMPVCACDETCECEQCDCSESRCGCACVTSSEE